MQPDIRLVAKAYIDRGWAVVPLVRGEKRASSSWRTKVYDPSDFKGDSNIAVKCGEPSGWLVDVDCDAHEAVAVAKLLLPQTGLVHGRPGKEDSHYWYVSPQQKSHVWKDVKDTAGATATLLEIRSTGGYTMAPPSVHPSGDLLAWTIDRDPLIIAPDEQERVCTYVAIGALLARHWPGPGARHHMVGHLAGFLLRYGVPEMFVVPIISAAAVTAADPDVNDRVVFAKGTIAKWVADKTLALTGGPKLAESLGDDVVARLRAWLGVRDEDAIEEFNKKHFWVRLGKDDVIGREDDPSGVIFQRPRALYTEYANHQVQVGVTKKAEPKFKSVFEAWLESRSRRSYRSVVFAPPPRVAASEDYNLWRGFSVEPQPGDCSRYLEHLHENVCRGNGDHYKYLLNLLALTVQQPGVPSGVAVVLRGKSGTGKGMAVQPFLHIFGRRHSTHLDKVDQLAGNFNAALSGKVIVFADEAFFAGDKREHGALKRLITEPTLHIVRKGIDGVDENNSVHLFMATNERWSWPAMMHERRGFLLEMGERNMQDKKFFGALLNQLRGGGLAGLLALLLEHQTDWELVRDVPVTEELRVQQTQSQPPHITWWEEALFDGNLLGGWPTFIASDKVYDLYAQWINARQIKRFMNKIGFGQAMGRYISAEKSYNKRTGKDQTRGYNVRPLAEARAYFDAEMGSTRQWPDAAGKVLPF